MKAQLRVATCQFAVEADVAHNRRWVLRQIRQAARGGARIVHFCETALSGYAGIDLEDVDSLDWDRLREATEDVCRAAAQHGVWVLLGSTHRLSDDHKPHNSVYVISDQGQIVERYDKRFCTGVLNPRPQLDLAHYSPGNRAVVFEVDGFRCSTLICYDYRFPELYRDLKRRGVELLFQSFHNGRRDEETYRHGNLWKELVPATMMCHAATNFFWISASNTTARYSLWPSFFVRPDGQIAGRLKAHRPGVLLTDVDSALDIWDAPGPWRQSAMDGQLHSGQLVCDPRSQDRQSV